MPSAKQRQAADDLFHSRWEKLGDEGLLSFEKTYTAIWWLIGDVHNGGFDQYFFNSSGDLAIEALEGLRQIGAKDTECILQAALEEFGTNGYTNDRSVRQDRMDDLVEPQFDVLDRKFYEMSDAADAKALDWLANNYLQQGLIHT